MPIRRHNGLRRGQHEQQDHRELDKDRDIVCNCRFSGSTNGQDRHDSNDQERRQVHHGRHRRDVRALDHRRKRPYRGESSTRASWRQTNASTNGHGTRRDPCRMLAATTARAPADAPARAVRYERRHDHNGSQTHPAGAFQPWLTSNTGGRCPNAGVGSTF